MNRLLTVSVLLLLLPGCFDLRASVVSSGVEEWRLVELDRIGTADGEDELMLTRIRDLLPLEDRLLAADVVPGGMARVLELELDGTLRGMVGGAGEGPGEYSMPARLQRFGDTLWVVDENRARAHAWVDGAVAGAVQLPLQVGRARTVPLGMVPDGTVLARYNYAISDLVSGAVESSPVVRIDREGQVVDTVLTTPFAPEDFWSVEGSVGHTPVQRAPLTMLPSDGSVFMMVDRTPVAGSGDPHFTLHVYPLDGRTPFTVNVPYDPIPVEVDALMAAIPAEASEAVHRAVRDNLESFEHLPPVLAVGGMHSESDGAWIRVHSRDSSTAVWEVIDLERRERVARVRTPPGLSILHVAGDELWGTLISPVGVPVIVRYAIDRGGP
jgi:hypothetical protein